MEFQAALLVKPASDLVLASVRLIALKGTIRRSDSTALKDTDGMVLLT